MSKKTDTTAEIISEKQEAPVVIHEEKPVEVVNVVPSIIVPVLPPVKEVPEETAQDPNLLISQAQAAFRGYLKRKGFQEFKSRPPVVLRV